MSDLPDSLKNRLPYHHDWKPIFETSYGIQVKWFGCWGNDPSWSIDTSRLASDLICFFYLKKGVCKAEVNGTSIRLKPGELLILRGGDVFSGVQSSDDWQLSLSACLSLNQGSETNLLLNYAYDRLNTISKPQRYEDVFYKVMISIEEESQWRGFRVSGALFTWLAVLLEELRPQHEKMRDLSKTVQRILDAQEWIMKDITKGISVSKWAEEFGLNVDYFSRLFKVHTGVSPKAWIIERRLQIAEQYLTSSDDTVEAIACNSGFNCPYYFSRAFKNRFGIPPGEYRSLPKI